MSTSITIIMGSNSDQPVADKVINIFNQIQIEYDLYIASAHRTPELVKKIVEESKSEIFIAIAGLSAALPGVIAAHTIKPVIGVPVSGKVNLDSILSIVQMPPGIPVATVGLDNGENAAVLAIEILSLTRPKLGQKLIEYRAKSKERIIKMNEKKLKD